MKIGQLSTVVAAKLKKLKKYEFNNFFFNLYVDKLNPEFQNKSICKCRVFAQKHNFENHDFRIELSSFWG